MNEEDILKLVNDIDNYSLFYILNVISNCDKVVKKSVLKNSEITNKIKFLLLESCQDDYYKGFERIMSYLTPSEFLSLYSIEDLKNYFSGDKRYQEYKLFSCSLLKDINNTISYALENNEIFNELFKLVSNYYSAFSKIDYKLLVEVIYKMQKEKLDYNFSFISSLSATIQRDLLKENFEFEYLVKILNNSKIEVISDFFLNDIRRLFLYNKINLKQFILNGIKFNSDIINQDEFWELIKDNSLVSFRKIINALEKNSYTDTIDKKVSEYYDKMISSYDNKNEMFSIYVFLIENPIIIDKGEYRKSYLLGDNEVFTLRRNLQHENNELSYVDLENIHEELRKSTSLKLTEIIVDYLFKDNYYNVVLNIKEMLRFNQKLDDKVIDNEMELVYKMILDFDSLSNGKKIEIYHKYKNSNLSMIFYQNLRKLKDVSYDLINDELFNLNYVKVLPDEKLTEEYGVEIYDLREKEFTMLIRGQKGYREEGNTRRNCYSVISNVNTNHYGSSEYLIYYGYNSFHNDRVMHVLEQDSFSADLKDDVSSVFVNRIMTTSEIVKSSGWYSEFDLVNVKNENGKYNNKKPDFIVAFDNIEEKDINEAERLDLPIVLIKTKLLEKKDVILDEIETSKYIDNEYDEKEVRSTR